MYNGKFVPVFEISASIKSDHGEIMGAVNGLRFGGES